MKVVNSDLDYEKYQSNGPRSYNSKVQEERGQQFPVRNMIFISFLAILLLFVYTTKLSQYHEGLLSIVNFLVVIFAR